MDEYRTHANIDELFKDADLNFYRTKLQPVAPEKIDYYQYALNSFRTFEGKEKKAKDMKEIEQSLEKNQLYSENSIFLEEHQFIKNFKNVFGIDCGYFGKMLYIWMAKGFDKHKISFHTFIGCMYPLFNPDNR